MSIKKTITKLEKHIGIKFPEYEAKFYSNRRNSCIHMGLDKAIFAYSNLQDLMKQINLFLDKHIPNKFSGNFPRLIHSTKWKLITLFRQKVVKKVDNTYMPKFVSNNIPWYERDGLNAWYEQMKCNEFLEDTDNHFKILEITDFDVIYNKKKKHFQMIK